MPLDGFGLGPERSSSKITYDNFIDVCSKFAVKDRETYENLDYFRLKSIPEILQQRRLEGCVFLEKTELQILAEWRRKHDFQHANTPAALASNSIKTVREVSHAAFALYGEARHYVPAILELQKLEGVSFPIASLILAEYDPVNIPYITEGVYRWLREDESREGTWDRKIDYIMKQYRVYIQKVAEVRGRLKAESGFNVTALDVERVGRQINEYAFERRKKSVVEEDDMLLRPLGTWSSKKKSLAPPLPESQRPPKHPPPKKKKGAVEQPPPAVPSPAETPLESGGEWAGLFEEPARTVTIPKPFKESKRTDDDGRWRPY